MSIAGYFNTMLDTSMDWKMADQLREDWGGAFCLKGVMSAADARRAVEIGADAIMISNHGGRQLDGSRVAARNGSRLRAWSVCGQYIESERDLADPRWPIRVLDMPRQRFDVAVDPLDRPAR